MNTTSLYQQFKYLDRNDDELHFCKKKWSSQVRRLPAIYNKLMSELWFLNFVYLGYYYPSKQLIIHIMDTIRKKSSLYIILISLILITLVQSKFERKSVTSRHSNMNYVTDYTFEFKTAYAYSAANVRIGFPITYSLSAFEPQL